MKKNSKASSAKAFKTLSAKTPPHISGRGSKLADYCDAPPARTHRQPLPFNFGELRIVDRPYVRRGKYKPQLGAIHIVWPFRVLISFTTKRHGLRLSAWIDDGERHTWKPDKKKRQ